ncbi:MAG: DUF4430 domain-containing protein [Bacillota bacterium]
MKNILIKGLVLLGILVLFLGACACGSSPNGEDVGQVLDLTGAPDEENTKAPVEGDVAEGDKQVELKQEIDAEKVSQEKAQAPPAALPKEADTKGEDKNLALAQPEKPVLAEQVTLRVTKNFGREIIFHETVPIKKDWTVMDLLQAHLEVETKWDGGFVNGINGLESEKGGIRKERQDWFFYVNGVCADGGAAAYRLQSNDQVWWDYHLWNNMGSAISALVGSYPEPFIHSYRGKGGPVTVMSSPQDQHLAEKTVKALKAQGAAKVAIGSLDVAAMENRKGPVLVLGVWDDLKEITWLAKFNEAYRKTGMGVHFTDGGVELFTSHGELGETVKESAGIIAATGAGLGDENPLWLLVGTDAQGLNEAVKILTESPKKISGMYQAAVVSGKVLRLPLEPK